MIEKARSESPAVGAQSSIDVDRAAGILMDRGSGSGGSRPQIYIVLGSGLSSLVDRVEDAVSVPFSALPGFPAAGVVGHAGRFVLGRIGGRSVMMQAGRFHLYEGHAPELVVAPVRIAARVGVRTAVFTNAAGGVDRRLEAGDIMLIDDHLNLSFRSPLAGAVREGEDRFPDMSRPYDPDLQALASRTAADLRIPLGRGTYAGLLGPSYETRAEIRMLALMGASAVGMSTIPEVITARAGGLRVLGFSLITNPAAGQSSETLDHADVLEVGRVAGTRLANLIESVVERWPA